MIKQGVLFLLLGFQIAAYNQVLTGIVIDKTTKEKLPFAALYFSGTTVGVSTDINGKFVFDISKYATKPISISAMGYYSKVIQYYESDPALVIKLRPQVYDLEEAVVKSKSLVRQRKANLRIFRREFIGETENAWECKILNEEDITFNYYFDEDTLKAYASKPIVIKNKALGYKITYFLDQFEFYRDKEYTFFVGNFIFEEDTTSNKESIERKREEIYLGSRMHFIRSLWANQLNSNNFKILDEKGKLAKYKDIVVVDNEGNKYLKNEGMLTLYYRSKETQLILSTRLLAFTQEGSYDASGILWKGNMGFYRIADWLPLEYGLSD